MMLRPQHFRSAPALVATPRPTRSLSTPSPRQADNSPSWPLLKRRNRPDHDTFHAGGASLIESLKSRRDALPTEVASSTAESDAKRDAHVMLVVQGLSPNLNASDFYRLAPSDLSSWQSVIKKVQQQRDPATLEPLGRYHISFATATAAISYRDRLLRLHKLAHQKLDNANGLWESCVPAHLRSAAGDDPASELESFTVTSGSAKALDVRRRRVAVTHKWEKGLKEITDRFEYGEKPPVVLVHVYPPTVKASDFDRFIREDGVARGCEWKVCPPQELRQPILKAEDGGLDGDDALDKMATAPKMIDTQEKLRSRFVVICANDVEARRFHRHWNQRTLTAAPEDTVGMRNIVHASIVNW
ncbi:hypothetical protein EsHS_00005937 [Epichloe bromicola]